MAGSWPHARNAWSGSPGNCPSPRAPTRSERASRSRGSPRTRSCRSRTINSRPTQSTVDYSAVFGLWVIVFTLAPGLFQPLEQEVGRALAHRRAQGIGGGPLVKRAATLGGFLALLAVVGCDRLGRPDHRPRVQRRNACCSCALLIGIVVYYVDVHRARHARRQRPVRPVRHDARRARASFASSRRSRSSSSGVTARAPTGSRSCCRRSPRWRSACAASTDLLEPGPAAPYSELSTRARLSPRRLVLCQALSYSAYIAAIVLQDARARGSRRQVRGRHPDRPHPAPRLPSRAGRAAAEARAPRGRGTRRRVPHGAAPARA